MTRDSRRAFTITQKHEILYQQDGKCANCFKKLDIRVVEYDHIKAWAAKGRTITQNGAALCPNCHRLKTHHERLKAIEKPKKSDKPKTMPKLLSKQELNALPVTKLREIAKNHGIKVVGTAYENILWGTTYTNPPTRRQYINKLFGLASVKDLKPISK